MGPLPLRDSGGTTALVDIVRLGASEMMPQPCEADDSAAVSIKALTRQSKTAPWATEVDDLGNEGCTGHREDYLQQ